MADVLFGIAVPPIVSIVTALVVSYFKDVSFKIKLEARTRYLKHLKEQLTDLYLPLYTRFATLFKYTDEFFKFFDNKSKRDIIKIPTIDDILKMSPKECWPTSCPTRFRY